MVSVSGESQVTWKYLIAGQTSVSNSGVQWKTGPWSACSKACGPGSQERDVACVRIDDGTYVRDSVCAGAKPVTSQDCETATCTPAGTRRNGVHALLPVVEVLSPARSSAAVRRSPGPSSTRHFRIRAVSEVNQPSPRARSVTRSTAQLNGCPQLGQRAHRPVRGVNRQGPYPVSRRTWTVFTSPSQTSIVITPSSPRLNKSATATYRVSTFLAVIVM
ncbi:A disintegrin and metalloproteinase with thrombospondin motifs 13-like isoform X3 [Nematostella vectensis]|nr:A disintegrin and metalloproteinase with thrombospondin motifs 13-like isoform X3 [Nematostella vectensis]